VILSDRCLIESVTVLEKGNEADGQRRILTLGFKKLNVEWNYFLNCKEGKFEKRKIKMANANQNLLEKCHRS
jgi:hypothetical protein